MRHTLVLATLCLVLSCRPATAPTPFVEFSGRWQGYRDTTAVSLLLGVDQAYGTVEGTGSVNGVSVIVTGSAGRSGMRLTLWPIADQCPCDAFTYIATARDGGGTLAGEFHDAGLSPRRCAGGVPQFDHLAVRLTRAH